MSKENVKITHVMVCSVHRGHSVRQVSVSTVVQGSSVNKMSSAAKVLVVRTPAQANNVRQAKSVLAVHVNRRPANKIHVKADVPVM